MKMHQAAYQISQSLRMDKVGFAAGIEANGIVFSAAKFMVKVTEDAILITVYAENKRYKAGLSPAGVETTLAILYAAANRPAKPSIPTDFGSQFEQFIHFEQFIRPLAAR